MVGLSILFFLLVCARAFVPSAIVSSRSSSSWCSLRAVTKESISDVGYTVSLSRPLGVVFGENPAPFLGLVVDEVEKDLPGDAAGLKVGDQLLRVNEKIVTGKDFETVIDMLRGEDFLELQLFRGTVKQLYAILANRQVEGVEEEEEEEEEVVVMDENYVSPVQIPLDQFEEDDLGPVTAKEVFEGLKKLGGMAFGSKDGGKEKKGLFGGMFSGETVQLDGDEASGLK